MAQVMNFLLGALLVRSMTAVVTIVTAISCEIGIKRAAVMAFWTLKATHVGF